MQSLATWVSAGLLCLSLGCRPTQPARVPVSVSELESKLLALTGRLGPDAYQQPETETLLRELAQISPNSPDYDNARELMEFIRAKRQLAARALADTAGEPPAPTPSGFGPAPMKQAPAEPMQVERIAVGSTRGELLSAYGHCLTRQTWFAGSGGPTLELFQVVLECRSRFPARIFEVGDGRVRRITAGHLDGVMTRSSSDAERSAQARQESSR